MDKKAIIGVIGLGIMGSSFASNFLSRGLQCSRI
ncbi:NAD(P)-binding domain-containing protein [Methanosarcina barkeri]